jgi:hypothetical protein
MKCEALQARLAEAMAVMAALALTNAGTVFAVLGGVGHAMKGRSPLHAQKAPQQDKNDGARAPARQLHGADCSTRR